LKFKVFLIFVDAGIFYSWVSENYGIIPKI
jgi:hypothetical protein